MSDPLSPNGFVSARLIARMADNSPVSWDFPVVEGTARDVVQAEIRNRCTGDNAALMADPGMMIHYPAGPWAGGFNPDNPPIGMRPPVRPGGDPPVSVARPAPPQQPVFPATPRTTYVDPKTGAYRDLGPLPDANQRDGSDQRAMSDLESRLADWRQTYGITSAEFFLFINRVTGYYASQLVSRERKRV